MQKFFSICPHLETAVVRISVQGWSVVIFVIHMNDFHPLKRKGQCQFLTNARTVAKKYWLGPTNAPQCWPEQTHRYSNFIKKQTDKKKIFKSCLVGPDFSPNLCDLDSYLLGIQMRSPNTFLLG